jgi:hypothetical protein
VAQTIDETDLIARAASRDFSFVQRETDTGQLVWAWRKGEDTRYPRFLTRREAFAWMEDQLGRGAAFG